MSTQGLQITYNGSGAAGYGSIQPTNTVSNFNDLVLCSIGGNVAIGKLAPSATLDVSGTVVVSGSLGINTTTPYTKIDIGGSNAAILGSIPNPHSYFSGGANAAWGGIAFGTINGNSPTIHATNKGNGTSQTGLRLNGAASNTDQLLLASNGINVGIGKYPSYPLDVDGIIGLSNPPLMTYTTTPSIGSSQVGFRIMLIGSVNGSNTANNSLNIGNFGTVPAGIWLANLGVNFTGGAGAGCVIGLSASSATGGRYTAIDYSEVDLGATNIGSQISTVRFYNSTTRTVFFMMFSGAVVGVQSNFGASQLIRLA